MKISDMTDKERLIRLETQVMNQEANICAIFNDIREIKDKLLGRPSWAVTVIITALSTLCVSLIVLILT